VSNMTRHPEAQLGERGFGHLKPGYRSAAWAVCLVAVLLTGAGAAKGSCSQSIARTHGKAIETASHGRAAQAAPAEIPPALPAPARGLQEGCKASAGDRAEERRDIRQGKNRPASLYLRGEAMARAHQFHEAGRLFRELLQLEPGNLGAELGLAHALSAQGHYTSAAILYDRVLQRDASNYDALQGKAFILLWTGHTGPAVPLLQRLATMNPADAENHRALTEIARLADAKHWAAMQPGPGAPAAADLGYYMSYMADHPSDATALGKLATAAVQLKDYAPAIHSSQRALEAAPNDRDIQFEAARVLAWSRDYDAAIGLYERMLRETPGDPSVLERLAKVYAWSGRLDDSLRVEKELGNERPSDRQYPLQAARLEMRLHQNAEAQKSLAVVLRDDPTNHEARLDLARLDLKGGKIQAAAAEFDTLLGQNFRDPDALYGEAQVDYYLGDPRRALPFATRAVDERPRDFDSLLLLARIERSLDNRNAARALLARASQLSPQNAEVEELQGEMRRESSVTISTRAAYAREIAVTYPLSSTLGPSAPGQTVEDLNTYGGATRISFDSLPRTTSYVSVSASPSNTPLGPFRGATAPAQFLYGQSTQLFGKLTVRGGVGMVRMGPGEIFDIGEPPGTIRSVAFAPVGYGGASLALTPKLSVDFTAARTAIDYTPAAVRFGVRQTRLEAGLNYDLDSRTRLQFSYFNDVDHSAVYYAAYGPAENGISLDKNGRDWGNGGQATFTRNLFRSERYSFSAGYAGELFGYAGQRRGVFMGFFNPERYQSHFLTTHSYGRLWGPLSYDLIADIGAQQTEVGQPFTRAERLGPALTWRASRHLSITVSYLHYNFSQSLGSLRGNAVQFSTEYHF
jgi:tetratricopeptide (TPR) repeat protein